MIIRIVGEADYRVSDEDAGRLSEVMAREWSADVAADDEA